MRSLLSVIITFLSVLTALSQSAVSIDEVRQAGLYIVEITTVDGEEPQGKPIESPLYPGSYNMTYVNKVPCRVVISKDGNTLYDSGEYLKKTSGATLRINGNTTAYYSDPLNMPYKLKLEKAVDLLNRGDDDKYKDKEWRLLKDAVSLNTIVGLQVSQLLELEWTAAYVPCNVIINGDYRGCYLLMETMKRNESCRINCDKQTGFIVEKDPYWWKEDRYFSSSWYKDDNVYRWTWKYPDSDEVTDEQETYIKSYIEMMESSLADGTYEKYIDIPSFAKWILAHDILGTRDSWGSNMYIKKYDDTEKSKLELPCVWDFDSSYDIIPGEFSNLHIQENEYFYALFHSDNQAFKSAYMKLWNAKKQTVSDRILSFLNKYADSSEGKALDISRKLYNKRFGYTYPTVAEDIKVVQQWYNSHISLLNENIQSHYTKISDVQENTLNDVKYYTLTGREVYSNNIKGVTIIRSRDGKTRKVLR